MDLKFRFQNSENHMNFNKNIHMNETRHDSLDKYARTKKNVDKTEQLKQTNSNASVNNYMKKRSKSNKFVADIAPENQFRRYLLDTKNVFYQDRQDLALYQRYNTGKFISAVLFLILTLTYLSLWLIQPFPLVCPSNAKCGVFVHCFEGYEYQQNDNTCVVSSQLIDQTENMMMKVIKNLQYQYGQLQCSEEGQSGKNIPVQTVDELFMSISDPLLRRQVINKIQNYLNNKELQEQIGFEYHSYNKMIIPTQKFYTLGCRLSLFFNNRGSRIKLAITFLIICIVWLLINFVRRFFKARFLYQELRKKTLAEKRINISYVKQDLQQKYGVIDEQLWKSIDSYRNKDRDIVFLQDDFLYWQAL